MTFNGVYGKIQKAIYFVINTYARGIPMRVLAIGAHPDDIDFPDMVRTCSRYRGFQCGADYAEGFRQCHVYLKGTTKRMLP